MEVKSALSLVALLLLVVALPVAGIVIAGRATKSKNPTFHELYPDDHLFV